ncbi:transposase [Aeromonas caviae]|nr:transposase [Aeromonas caviae]
MSKTTTEHKKTLARYSQPYKDEALALAESVGMSKAAAQLGLKEAQLYAWRIKARQVMNTGVHIPADHEHQFRFNVNTISGPM